MVNLPDRYHQRHVKGDGWREVLFREGQYAQGAEWNEVQALLQERLKDVADGVYSDGDIIRGCEIVLDSTTGEVKLGAGSLYIGGIVYDVEAATLTVPLTGTHYVGVHITESVLDDTQDPSLRGPDPQTRGYGEPGAYRLVKTAAWAVDGENPFYAVYTVTDGVVTVDAPLPEENKWADLLARYDREANGSYVVTGNVVKALGKNAAGEQEFSISEGVANIWGYKREHLQSFRLAEPEVPDLKARNTEPHVFDDGGTGTATITVNHGPIASVTSVVVTKEVTETVTHQVAGGTDALANSSVVQVISVTQGTTTYVEGTDYTVSGDAINWSPGGAEPAVGSTYDVVYQYFDTVPEDSFTDDTITVSGGVTGSTVLLSYMQKLPRKDIIGLQVDGTPVYIKGVSAEFYPQPPHVPDHVLALAVVSNDWRGTPGVRNTGIRSIPYEDFHGLYRVVHDLSALVAEERLKTEIGLRDAASKRGYFADPLVDDRMRDAGVSQDAAVVNGELLLPIDANFADLGITSPMTLPFNEAVVLEQPMATGCMKINPYQAFAPVPAVMELDPSVDYWEEHVETFTSGHTREFLMRLPTVNVDGEELALLESTREEATFLRQITVDFTIRNMGPGETVTSLTFDGIDVNPGSLVADSNGVVTGSFTIPPNVPAGVKIVSGEGGSGTVFNALFEGRGVYVQNTVERIPPAPPPPPPPMSFGIMGSGGGGGIADGAQGIDPLAQTFDTGTIARYISKAQVKFCEIGDVNERVIVQVRRVRDGVPTKEILTEGDIDMSAVTINEWTDVVFGRALYLSANDEVALVLLTNDPTHAVAIATLGEFDDSRQAWVTQQAFANGVLLSSSNAETWTPHQKSDLAFKLVGANFTATSTTTLVATVPVTGMTDFAIRAAVTIPSASAEMHFEVELPDGSVVRCAANERVQLTDAVTGDILVRVVMTGTPEHSPILWPGAMLVWGVQRATGTYVTRAWDCGDTATVNVLLDVFVPSGSSLTAEVEDNGGGTYTALPSPTPKELGDGWYEYEYQLAGHTAIPQSRLKLTLNGTPAARPVVKNVRLWVT